MINNISDIKKRYGRGCRLLYGHGFKMSRWNEIRLYERRGKYKPLDCKWLTIMVRQ